MIIQIDQDNRHRHRDILEQCYRLRHAVFVEEMRWEALRRPDSREIDQYDVVEAVEFAYVRNDEVVGYQRLLPTTGPHLLHDLFPYLCDGNVPCAPDIWEWSRYAIRRDLRSHGSAPGEVAVALGIALVEWGLSAGVGKLIVEMPPIQLLRLVMCHFRAYPLGVTHVIDGSEIMAVQAEFDERTLERLLTFGERRGVRTQRRGVAP